MTDRKMPVKLADLDFTEDGYPGFTCTVRLNLTMGAHRRGRQASTEEEGRAYWMEVFPSWDFVDEKGNPIPHTFDGFDLITDDLFEAMKTRRSAAVKETAMPRNLDDSSSRPEAETPAD